MNDHQLSYCNVCTNKQFDPQQGFICKLTGRKPDFEGACPTFNPAEGADISRVGKSKSYQPYSVGTGKRFANHVIDVIFVSISSLVVVAVVSNYVLVFNPDYFEEYIGPPWWVYFIILMVTIFYYAVMEAGYGRTIGKLITGTHVVDSHGKRPSAVAIFKRTLIRFIPFDAFSYLGDDARGWHDKWSDTWVVQKDTSENIFADEA
jgi:uncharacterized RDD family membrane protein YckC